MLPHEKQITDVENPCYLSLKNKTRRFKVGRRVAFLSSSLKKKSVCVYISISDRVPLCHLMLSQKHAIVAKNRMAPMGFGSAISLTSLLQGHPKQIFMQRVGVLQMEYHTCFRVYTLHSTTGKEHKGGDYAEQMWKFHVRFGGGGGKSVYRQTQVLLQAFL